MSEKVSRSAGVERARESAEQAIVRYDQPERLLLRGFYHYFLTTVSRKIIPHETILLITNF